jgi:hypothetical protein
MSYNYICSFAASLQFAVFCRLLWAFDSGAKGLINVEECVESADVEDTREVNEESAHANNK